MYINCDLEFNVSKQIKHFSHTLQMHNLHLQYKFFGNLYKPLYLGDS